MINKCLYSYLILPLVVFGSFNSFAQSPGYMGKKTSVQFNFSSSLAWFGPTTNNNGSEAFKGEANRYKLGLNSKYGVALNRSIGQYASVEVSADYGKTGYFDQFETMSVFDGASQGERDIHDLFLNARVTDIALAMRFFNRKKGSIAPLGLFLGPRIGYTQVRSEIIDRFTNYHHKSDGLLINSLGLNEQNTYYTIGFTTGYNRIINDQIIVNFTWDLAQYISADGAEVDWSLEGNGSYEDNNKKLQRVALRKRLSNMNLLLFRVGVGYIF